MSPLKIAGIVIIVALCLASMGCFGGGDGGGGKRMSSRGRFGLKKKRNAAASSRNKRRVGDVEQYSPEASMQRDLAQLKESEKNQVRMIKDMRSSLDQRSAQYQKEEEKLQDIRNRISSYDRAIQSQDLAAGDRRPARPATVMAAASVAPREGGAPRNVRASYSPDSPPAAPRQAPPRPRPSVAREGETVLFDPNDPEDRALMSPYATASAPSAPSIPQAGFMASPYEQPNDGWTPPTTLFAKSGRESGNFPPPDLYARRANAIAERNAASGAEFPPVRTEGTNQRISAGAPHVPAVQPMVSTQSMRVNQPAPPVDPLPPPPSSFLPPPSSTSAAPAVPAASGEEEVFTPDLFLSGSR